MFSTLYEGRSNKKRTRFGEQILAIPTTSACETGRSGISSPRSVEISYKNFDRNFITFLDHVVDVQGKMRERALHFEHPAQAVGGGERAATDRMRPFLAGSGRLRVWSMRCRRSAPHGRACAASNRAFLTLICSAVPLRCSRVQGGGACGRYSANHGVSGQKHAFGIVLNRSARRHHHVLRITCTY